MNGREMLKMIAKQAKDRLSSKSDSTPKTKYPRNFVLENLKPEIKTKIIYEDSKLDEKIKNVIQKDSICPLSEIIDFAYYKTLSKQQKERYFFSIAEKYKKVKDSLENEKIRQVF